MQVDQVRERVIKDFDKDLTGGMQSLWGGGMLGDNYHETPASLSESIFGFSNVPVAIKAMPSTNRDLEVMRLRQEISLLRQQVAKLVPSESHEEPLVALSVGSGEVAELNVFLADGEGFTFAELPEE